MLKYYQQNCTFFVGELCVYFEGPNPKTINFWKNTLNVYHSYRCYIVFDGIELFMKLNFILLWNWLPVEVLIVQFWVFPNLSSLG